MTAQTEQPAAPQLDPLVDDPSLKETYADSFVGLSYNQNNVRIVFATLRTDHTVNPAKNHRHVSARLVMPVTATLELYTTLGQMLDQMERQGLVRRGPAA